MMTLIVLGANSPVGAFFLRSSNEYDVQTWGRNIHRGLGTAHTTLDLTNVNTSEIEPPQGVLVSFAPIWHLASFLQRVLHERPGFLKDLVGVVACSSSSFMTKRFAFNLADKELASRLHHSQTVLISLCKDLDVPCQILAPTLVYGSCAGYQDKNLNRILHWMRSLPFIPVPKNSGLRQPIHARQLAMVAQHQARKMCTDNWGRDEPNIVTLGGDEILSYENMIRKLRDGLEKTDPASKCRIIMIPMWLHYLLVLPMLPISPRGFEAVLRIFSDLSGFIRSCEIIDEPPMSFPGQLISKEQSVYE